MEDQDQEAGTAKRARTHADAPQPADQAAEVHGVAEDHAMEEDQPEEPAGGEAGGQKADAHAAQGQQKEWFSDQNTVFVKGLPYGCKESDLREVFKDCAGLKKVRIPVDANTGKPRVGGMQP